MSSTLLKMAGAMLIGFIAGAAFNITDTYFVSKLGTDALAAMGFTFPVTNIIFGISMGLGIGTSSVVSRAIGKGNQHEVKRLATDSLSLGIIIVAGFVILGISTIRPLFRALGATEELLPYIFDYMSIWYCGVAFLVIPIIGNNSIRATGDTFSPSMVMLIDLGLNIILDPILIFGWGPIPAMGIKGAAIATVFCRALALIASLYILGYRKKLLSFELPAKEEVLNSWKKILYIGLPASFSHILMPVAAGIILSIVSKFGVKAVAAYSVGVRVEHFCVIPILALASSLLPFVGQNWGAGNSARLCRAQKIANLFTICWGSLCVLTIFITAPLISKLFTNDAVVIKNLITFLHIIPIAFIFRGLNHNSCGSMNAVNEPYQATTLMLIRLFVFSIPFAFAGARFLGFFGLLAGIVTAEIISGVLAILLLMKIYKKSFGYEMQKT